MQVLAAERCSCPSCCFGPEMLWPDTKAHTSGCLATRPQSRDHQAQTCFTAGCHTDSITEMAKKTLRDTFAQAGRWNWLGMCFKHLYQRAIEASHSKRRDSLNMWYSYALGQMLLCKIHYSNKPEWLHLTVGKKITVMQKALTDLLLKKVTNSNTDIQ